MSTTIYKKISASAVGNAAVKATPVNPVVVLDFGSGWLGQAIAKNIEIRVARGELKVPETLIHYFRCGASTETMLTAVRSAMSQVGCDMVTALYLSSIPRDTEAWRLAALSRQYMAVNVAVASAGEQTSNTLFVHRVDLWSPNLSVEAA